MAENEFLCDMFKKKVNMKTSVSRLIILENINVIFFGFRDVGNSNVTMVKMTFWMTCLKKKSQHEN